MIDRIYHSIQFWLMVAVVIWAFTFSWAVYQNRQRATEIELAAHRASVENCIAINELRRQLLVTLAEFRLPQSQLRRFLPTEKCEILP